MWIKRVIYDTLVRKNEALSAEVELKKDHVTPRLASYLEKEVEYWRDRFEREQRRADRITDTVVTERGGEPVTDLGVADSVERADKAERRKKSALLEIVEMFGDQIDPEGTAEGDDAALEIPPVADDLLAAIAETATK